MTFSKLLLFFIAFFCITYTYAQSLYLSYDNNLQLAVNTPSFVRLYGHSEIASQGIGSYVGLMYVLRKGILKKHISSDIIGVEGVLASKNSKIMDLDLSFITHTRAFDTYYMMNVFKEDIQNFYFKIGGGLVSLKTYDDTRPKTLVFALARPFFKTGFFVFIKSYNEDWLFPVGFDMYILKDEKGKTEINIFEMRAGFVYRIYSKPNSCVCK